MDKETLREIKYIAFLAFVIIAFILLLVIRCKC
jgi:hypothetical protein